MKFVIILLIFFKLNTPYASSREFSKVDPVPDHLQPYLYDFSKYSYKDLIVYLDFVNRNVENLEKIEIVEKEKQLFIFITQQQELVKEIGKRIRL